jgi:hypothetical protein
MQPHHVLCGQELARIFNTVFDGGVLRAGIRAMFGDHILRTVAQYSVLVLRNMRFRSSSSSETEVEVGKCAETGNVFTFIQHAQNAPMHIPGAGASRRNSLSVLLARGTRGAISPPPPVLLGHSNPLFVIGAQRGNHGMY